MAVFEDALHKSSLRHHFGTLDSCGTANYHEGEEPDERTTALLRQRNIPYDSNNLARGITPQDYHTFDYIFGMDKNNERNLKSMQPKGSKAVVRMFGDVDDGRPIADPYYIGNNGFEDTYRQVLRYSRAFLRELGLGDQAKS